MWEPFGSVSGNATATWKAGPTERGTLNILSTCVITLILCVWTVLHLNIPEHGKATRQITRKTGWLVFGLLAPELVAMVALKQWYDAKKLTKTMNALLQSEKEVKAGSSSPTDVEARQRSSPTDDLTHNPDDQQANTTSRPRRYNKWTLTHSHYALMGGFVFDTSVMARNILPAARTRVTITPFGLETLAKCVPDFIPDISESSINDKSKANALAKLLVCAQAVWFAVNAIGRLASRHPISLLELNTFVHAICCLATYAAWWSKPFDVDEPTVILVDSDRVARWCAIMVMSSLMGEARQCKIDEGFTPTKSWWQSKRLWGKLVPSYETFGGDALDSLPPSTSPEPVWHLRHYQRCYGFTVVVLDEPRSNIYLPLAAPDLHCIQLASRFEEHEGKRSTSHVFPYSSPIKRGEYVTPRTFNMPQASYHRGREYFWEQWFDKSKAWAEALCDPVTSIFGVKDLLEGFFDKEGLYWFGFMVAASLYGGVHLFAWNGPFTTTRATMLWRVSSLIIIAPTPVFLTCTVFVFLWVLCFLCISRIWKSASDIRQSGPKWARIILSGFDILLEYFQYGIFLSLLFLINAYALFYIAARLFLVVESFISLAYVPAGVYVVPSWSQYIPHFGSG